MTLPVLYPMGAKTLTLEKLDLLWEDKMWVGERKYDGSRYLMRKENGEVRFVSRQKSKKTGFPVDKTENVPHLVKMLQNIPDGTILDGEIITHDNCTSKEVTSIMGSLPEVAIEKQKERGYVTYVVFDLLMYKHVSVMEQPFHLHRQGFQKLLADYVWCNGEGSKRYVQQAEVVTENLREVYEYIVDNGGEGMILKHLRSKYEPGKKPSDTWVKVKKEITADVVIMGYTQPDRDYDGKHIETWPFWYNEKQDRSYYRQNEDFQYLLDKGYIPVKKPFYNEWIGSIEFGQYNPKGELIKLGKTKGLSDEMSQFFTDNQKEMIGQVIEVKAMEQEKDTYALRHPRFIQIREDKNAEECKIGEY